MSSSHERRAGGRAGRWLRALAPLLLGAAALAATSCDGAPSRTSARDSATKASCDWYAMCGRIGAGGTYPDRDSCEVQVRALWDGAWPAADCDGKINGSQLDVCLSAIRATECSNLADVGTTLIIKCPRTKICGASASADGG
jgi:hypothetical protein